LAEPILKKFDMGGISGTIYTFAAAGDTLPMHNHAPGAEHISIVGNGKFKIIGKLQEIEVIAGQVVDFRPNQSHEFIALVDNSLIINIVKGVECIALQKTNRYIKKKIK